MKISLLRPWLLALGIINLLGAATLFVLGMLSTQMISLSAEVYARELIAEGAVNTDQAGALLEQAGMPFDPDAGKKTGLGAYIVRDSDLHRARIVNRVACGLLVLNGFVLGVAAFGKPPGQSVSS